MIYFRHIYCYGIYLIITCISSASEVDSMASVLELPSGSNSYTNSNPLSGSKVQKNDNPNAIQNLMAEGFIRSVENLFANNEESNHEEVGKVEDYAKLLPPVLKGKEWRSNGKASRYLREKRSAAVFTCRMAGPRRVECGLGPLVYDIALPRPGMSQRSIGDILKRIHHYVMKRHVMGKPRRPTPDSTMISTWLGKRTYFRPLDLVSGKNPETPPDLRRASSKGLLKRESPFSWINHPDDMRRKLVMSRKSRCKKRPTTPRLSSANEGKTALINFPSSHRCIRQTCPCRVTKVCLPPRTTCPEEPTTYVSETPPRCSDLVESEVSSSTECKPKADACSTAQTLSSKRRPFEKSHLAGKRACGSCDCRCGCPCQQEGLRSHPQAVVGGSSCGCSCGCGCVHDRPAHEHLHYIPDASPYKT